ncbi:MAG: glutathione peroxidase [bacterium]|jgi:glutathione peroxidase
MKIVRSVLGYLTAGLLAIGCGSASRQISSSEKAQVGVSLYDFELLTLNGKDKIDLRAFKGKYVLFVNVASKCGYTPQYKGLQALYSAHSDALMIIGLPCNQFGFQEPGDSTAIETFCSANYGVTFPISEKLDVKGDNQHPLYTWLTKKDYNGVGDYQVTWNFNKFLISPSGELIAYFGSKTKPESDEITSLLKDN